MAAKAVIRLTAAMTIFATSAMAQTNDPNLTQAEIDCLNRASAAGTDCAKDGDDGKDSGGKTPAKASTVSAVFLPALIVDLFPNPALVTEASIPPGNTAAPPTAPPSGLPAIPAAAPGGPVVAPTDLVATEPPRAVIGDFVPDEVLVTVNGDAGAVQQIAASFGLEIRSQRQSRLLGNTLVRFGIPDGRPVGVVLAQLCRRRPHFAA